MIYYVTGGLGAGKTMYGVRKAALALNRGKVVATNVRFVDGWEHILARRNPYYVLSSRKSRMAFLQDLSRRYCYVDDIPTLLGSRIFGKGERRGLMVVDEAHNELNNREWEKQTQKEALKLVTLHRKRGWETYVLSQHADNTDAAMRRIASVEIRVINWQQLLKAPVIQAQLLPRPFFLALGFTKNISSQVRSGGAPLFREVYRVSYYGRLYDTFQDYAEDLSDEGTLWLPHPPGLGAPLRPGNVSLPPGIRLNELRPGSEK